MSVWQEVLGEQAFGVEDDFLAVGGHSIAAAQVIARIRDVFGVDLALQTIFERPSIAALAAEIERQSPRNEQSCLPPLAPLERIGPLPLSHTQERMWFLHQLDPEGSAHNVNGALRLRGRVNQAALQYAVDQLVSRHESLRTAFQIVDDRLCQRIAARSVVRIQVIDLRSLSREQRLRRASMVAGQSARVPFDLTREPLMRVSLLLLDDEDSVIQFDLHHIICDAWSLAVIARELETSYNAFLRDEIRPLPALAIQYADYSAWQRRWLTDGVIEGQMRYWRKQLANLIPLQLPADYPRPPVQDHRGAMELIDLPAPLLDSLRRLSQRNGVTLFTTLLAGFKTLIYRYSGQTDLAIGVPTAGRTFSNLEGLIGPFVNTLVIRSKLSAELTFAELLGRLRGTVLDAFRHQDVPYARLVAELQLERAVNRTPLTQVMFNHVNVPMPRPRLAGLTTEKVSVDRSGSSFDLTMTVVDVALVRQVSIEYSVGLFKPGTIQRMLEHYIGLLRSAAAAPDTTLARLGMLSAPEREQLLLGWNDTGAIGLSAGTIHGLFEAQAAAKPSAVALRCGTRAISFGSLNEKANQLARHLRQVGVRDESLVGVYLERSPELVIVLLAILKAGGAYVPIDTAYPSERVEFMLRDSGVSVVVTRGDLKAKLAATDPCTISVDADWPAIAGQSTANLEQPVRPRQLAYAIYTSGSTGKPKAVLSEHRSTVNRLRWMWAAYPFTVDEVCCQKTSVSFVDSVWEIFGPLGQGIPLVIAPDAIVQDPRAFVNLLAREQVTRLVLVPSLLRALLDSGEAHEGKLPRLKYWTSSGDVLSAELARKFRKRLPRATLLNLYGSSEVAADALWFDTAEVPEDATTVPVGRPIANLQAYILDPYDQPVPVGVSGELHIGGLGVARGYLQRAELTVARFVRNPFVEDSAARLFRTGDLARYRADGLVEYLGRRDDQVKIRGHRVELGEVSAVLMRHPGVEQAVAGITRDECGEVQLTAYFVATALPGPTAADLRAFLVQALPAYMVPSHYRKLDALPMAPNGKIDVRSLPAAGPADDWRDRKYVAPRDATERTLAQLWQELLNVPRVGVRDNFFELGGHSILAARLFARVEQTLGRRLPLITLFQSPTIAALGNAIRRGEPGPASPLVIPMQPAGSRPPFFCVHMLGGEVVEYAELARLLGNDQPFFSIQARGVGGGESLHTSIEEMATAYIEAIRRRQAAGPYYLGGHCYGGIVAFEMARQLLVRGEQVGFLAILEGYAPQARDALCQWWNPLVLARTLRNAPIWLRNLKESGQIRPSRLIKIVSGKAWQRVIRVWNQDSVHALLASITGDDPGLLEHQRALLETQISAAVRYKPEPLAGRLALFRTKGMAFLRAHDPELGWGPLAQGGVDIHMVAGAHYNVLRQPHVETLATKFGAALRAAQARSLH